MPTSASRILSILCGLCAGCTLDWSSTWPVPPADSVDEARRPDRSIGSDRALDSGPESPCSDRAQPVALPLGWDEKRIKGCTTASAFDQCGAEASCNLAAGWHLCTASEYLNYGGYTAVPPPAARPAWIAACVRDGPVLELVIADHVCSTCSAGTDDPLVAQWDCAGAPLPATPFMRIGVAATDECNFVGADKRTGRWEVLPASTRLLSAICCRP
jgi:hypothetical protein